MSLKINSADQDTSQTDMQTDIRSHSHKLAGMADRHLQVNRQTDRQADKQTD